MWVYLYCDASPQKGAEFFAATINLFDGTVPRRCLLSCISTDATMLDGQGKMLAILWQLSLVARPSVTLFGQRTTK